MAASPLWDQLKGPSKAALHWAWASAVLRTQAALPDATVSSLDVLVGILLARGRNSEPRQLFEHFGIPYGAVNDQHNGYRAADLLAVVRRIPEEPPPLDQDARAIGDHAVNGMAYAHRDGLVPSEALFGALLELDNPASRAIREALVARGVDADAVIGSYREFLSAETIPYDRFLLQRHPYVPPRVAIPTYQSDQPSSRPLPVGAVAPVDLVGIRAEVDAFACLIASRALNPPLAIGLFGGWGSGKSFFLESLQRRIDALVNHPAARSRPQDQLPFYKSIVQIEFNAWQYVESNLWASLIEHIFRNLRVSSDDSDDLIAQRQRFYLEQLQQAGSQRHEARRERDRLEDEQRAAAAQVERRRAEREAALVELERRWRQEPLAGWSPSKELAEQVRRAADEAGIVTLGVDAVQLHATLDEAREALRRAGPLLAPLRGGGWGYALTLAAALLMTPLVSLGLQRLGSSAASSVAGSLTWIFAFAITYMKAGSAYLKKALGHIAKARADLVTAQACERAALDGALREAQDTLSTVEAQLNNAVARERELAAAVIELEQRLARTTPRSMLEEFVEERLGSEDYRRHLGVPALVRRDLERLSRLVEAENAEEAGPQHGNAINRIVLYIDDLDRCPTPMVAKVLQAVHLLLAFPLFVVVVAVDERWLIESLREHYGQLSGQGATPGDYLEKIFQVPFRVARLSADSRARMARRLATPSLRPSANGDDSSASADVGPAWLPQADDPEFASLVDSLNDTDAVPQQWLEAARLTVTDEELSLIEDAAALLGASPRSVKRFVNICLLVKSMRRESDDTRVLLLLAIAAGLPDLSRRLFAVIEGRQDQPCPLGQVVDELAPSGERDRLTAWLASRPHRQQTDVAVSADCLDLIRRFSFEG